MSQSTDGRKLEATATPEMGYGGGFRQQWVTGETTDNSGEKIEFSLDSGAGLGNRYLTLAVTYVDRKITVRENIDMAEFLKGWLESVLNDEDATKRKVHDVTEN